MPVAPAKAFVLVQRRNMRAARFPDVHQLIEATIPAKNEYRTTLILVGGLEEGEGCIF
jgi:hypothetical protein